MVRNARTAVLLNEAKAHQRFLFLRTLRAKSKVLDSELPESGIASMLRGTPQLLAFHCLTLEKFSSLARHNNIGESSLSRDKTLALYSTRPYLVDYFVRPGFAAGYHHQVVLAP